MSFTYDVMKKLTIAFLILVTGIVSSAQDTSIVQSYSEQDTSREKIKIRQLPEAVRESLNAPDYAGWKIDEAYEALATDPERPESASLLIYIIELKRRQERVIIKFDKEGKRLDQSDQE
jgi:hypothetical protein